MIPLLVIGFGNELRGDDAVGRRVAQAVKRRQWPGVRVLDVHQLTPELAEPLSQADQAIFIDARMCDAARGVDLIPLDCIAAECASGHRSNPVWLVALAESLYGHRPKAWLLAVPATEFPFGMELSASAQAGIEDAVRRIEEWTQTARVTEGVAGNA
jgi:hydrogenase maturation protease